jgi:hypothetical protein
MIIAFRGTEAFNLLNWCAVLSSQTYDARAVALLSILGKAAATPACRKHHCKWASAKGA